MNERKIVARVVNVTSDIIYASKLADTYRKEIESQTHYHLRISIPESGDGFDMKIDMTHKSKKNKKRMRDIRKKLRSCLNTYNIKIL
jgi:hypothetical protein